MVRHFHKVLKPPYKAHDIPALLGVLLLLLAIPVIVSNLSLIGSTGVRAAASPCPQFGNIGDMDVNGVVDLKDVQQIINIDASTSNQSSALARRGDVNGDGVTNTLDAQFLHRYIQGADVTVKACADNDRDGFPNVLEEYLGTNSYLICGTNAWPTDINNDQRTNISDLGKYSSALNKSATTPELKRLDLNRDGVVNISGDIEGVFKKYINRTCTIPLAPASVPPVTTFTSSSSKVVVGDPVTLTWKSPGAVSPCFGTGGFGVTTHTSGSVVARPTKTTTYSLLCGNESGSTTKSVTVQAASPCPNYIVNSQLYRKSNDSAVFLTENCVKRHVTYEGMLKCHYNWSAINAVSNGQSNADKYLNYLPNGSQINENTPCPQAPVVLCSGDPWVHEIYPNPNYPNHAGKLSASQLSNCNKYDRVYFHVQNGANYNPPPSCSLDNGTSCSTGIITPANTGSYPIVGCLDAAGVKNCSVDLNGQREYVWLNINQIPTTPPPPSDSSCGGLYHSGNTPNFAATGNFGDPNCDFSKNGLYSLLNQIDPGNRDYWYYTIIPCESGYNPNATFFGAPDPAGAWGLYQMGRGRAGQYDHGDVPWRDQTSNAINYNRLLSTPFLYWQCSYHY